MEELGIDIEKLDPTRFGVYTGRGEGQQDFNRFTKMMIALRKRHFALSREQFCNRVNWHGQKVGDADSRCAETCACENKSAGKAASATCKRECSACRKENAKYLQVCRDLGPPAAPRPARVARRLAQ